MSKGMVSTAGGLSAADRAKLVHENLREGVTLFEGTTREVVGTLRDYAVLTSALMYKDYATTARANQVLCASEVGEMSGDKFLVNRNGRYLLHLVSESSHPTLIQRHLLLNGEEQPVSKNDTFVTIDLKVGDELEFYVYAYFNMFTGALKCTAVLSPVQNE